MVEVDYAALLERARQGIPREELTPYMDALVDVNNNFENPTKLRLLGNAIANNKQNAAILQDRSEAIDRLLTLGPLGLQILYNGCVGNKEFAEALVTTPWFVERIKPDPVAKSLIGAVFEAMDNKVSQEIVAKLAVEGFVELILNDPSLEVHPIVVDNFATIYWHCQQITTAASEDPEDEDLTSLGFRVVGNISSHPEIGLEAVQDVPEEPYTWDTVALLVNLTAAKANLDAVFAHWPHLVANTIKLLKQEDPESAEVEEIELEPRQDHEDSAAENDEAAAEVENMHEEWSDEDDEENEEDAPGEPPFDLGLWGPLFRNIARYPPAARELAKYEPAKLVSRLLESPMLQDVAWDFASLFAVNAYDHDLVALITEPPFCGGSVLVASAAVQGLVEAADLPSAERQWAAPLLCLAVHEGLTQNTQVSVWIKGTRALAMLKTALPGCIDLDLAQLENKAPRDDAVQSNLKALN